MEQTLELEPLLLTKLYAPRLDASCLHRSALLDTLEAGCTRSVTLVSAPAGYGKSTLVAGWLPQGDMPWCWLSLDESDSDLRNFLRYFIAAVQAEIPDFCVEFVGSLTAFEPPTVDEAFRVISNSLACFDNRIAIVLDDYHLITGDAVHELLRRVLAHPPGSLHLIIVTRRNPPLPLASMRAKNQLTEVRMADLQFDLDEARSFLVDNGAAPLEESTVRRVQDSTEGWVAGLRLAALALRQHVNIDGLLQSFDGNTYDLQEYLVVEVLDSLEESQLDWMCKTAILQQFNAELVEYLCLDNGDISAGVQDGREFIRMLCDDGMFCSSLDPMRQWHRYHPLFQGLLLGRLGERYSSEDIAALHVRAAAWLESHGQISLALRHYLKSGSSDLAKATILKHQRVAFETEQVYRVLEWLELVGEIATRDPELLLARAWLSERAGRYAEVKEIVSRVETLLDEGAGVASAEIPRLRGECHTLSSGLTYLDANPDESIFYAERALELLPDGEASLGFAAMIKLVALQMKGEGEHARSFGRELLERNKFDAGAPRGRFLQGLCYLYWLSGDLRSLGRMAESLNEFSTDEGMPESVAYANYFRGLYSYHVDDLETARAVLEGLAVNERMVNYQIATNATCLLASVYKALDKPREAEVVLDSAIKENLVAGATASLAMAKACRAELALCRGAIEEAVQWADTLEAEPLRPGFRSVMPELVYLQVRMQQDTPESRAEVDELLATYEDFLRKTHTLPFLIKLLVLKALWEARRGDEHGALQALEEPVMLARKHGFTRMLADLGSDLLPLLNQLPLDEGGLAFVGGIIRAVSGGDRVDGEPPPTAAGPEQQTEIRVNGNVLSKREQQILQLLGERLGNAEIGEKLFISPATVKRHAHNIYEKLGVHGRREAVVKARGLGLLG